MKDINNKQRTMLNRIVSNPMLRNAIAKDTDYTNVQLSKYCKTVLGYSAYGLGDVGVLNDIRESYLIQTKKGKSQYCNFSMAWVGKCKNHAVDGHEYCTEHIMNCSSCGKPATHDCEETMGLVCGAPLCDKCTHTIQSNGCNSGGNLPHGLGAHCKKSEQKYDTWFKNTII
jgi:hypothetical protein